MKIFKNLIIQITRIGDLLKDLKEVLEKVTSKIGEHDQILKFYTGGTWDSSISFNGVALEIDYRDEEIYTKNKMVKCLLIKSSGIIENKYTREKNLKSEELEYFKKFGFVLVDTNK